MDSNLQASKMHFRTDATCLRMQLRTI
uniref:Uncharacterized protein n=1 Tax=Anguilla anguilla TaxID=7936 RepID=A0A0E9TV78_ANGAN